jgi:hypothetical protein
MADSISRSGFIMMMRGMEIAQDLARDIVKDNPNYAKGVNQVAPYIAGHFGGPLAKTTVSVASKVAPNAVAEIATGLAVVAVAQVGAIVAIPALAGYGIYKGIQKLFS